MNQNDAIKKFVREKGGEYHGASFLYDGYDWFSGVTIKNGGDKSNEDYLKVEYYKPKNLELSTGNLGRSVNSELVGDFLSRPKSVSPGRLGRTVPMTYKGETSLPKDDLEMWK